MSRYIDADKAKARFYGWKHERSICDEIDAVKSVDVVPVVHGHWIVVENDQNTDDRYKMQCSVCGGTLWSIESEEWYCCKCGAKMDEVIE